jgi:lipopolysaccharide/colanic/teichoic acid biosynthesis glycosyltransferase
MLRHKMKAGITGWAQINGWSGNTSIEKRIEYDLEYLVLLREAACSSRSSRASRRPS